MTIFIKNNKMKAMIFAAGKGTRLKPLTDNTPKALIEVQGGALLGHVINHLKKYGVTDIVINVHYLSEQIVNYLKSNNNFGINISISDESDLLLDTGGGLLKAAHFFNKNEDFIVYNVDILSDINLDEMLAYHKTHKSLATLAVRDRQTSRYFLFDKNLQLRGWKNTQTGYLIKTVERDKDLLPLAFSGIHILNARFFDLIQETGAFSITSAYLQLANKHKIIGFRHDSSQWFDIGKAETLKAAELNFKV